MVKDTETFKKEANKIHNNKFSYDKTNYINTKTKVIITCPTHGDFEQTPYQHLKGRGCKKCATEYTASKLRFSEEEVIRKAKEVHGDFFDYSDMNYENVNKYINIICPIHGSFKKFANSHLQGEGCKKCNKDKINPSAHTLEQFVEKANASHSNKYDYSLVEYKNNKLHIDVICTIHGVFKTRPDNHINKSSGCPKCKNIKVKKDLTDSQEDFLLKAEKTHGDLYDYGDVVYVKSHNKVKIRCKKHGIFEQKPYGHIQGYGCPKCVNKISKAEQEIFDFINNIVPCRQSDRKTLGKREIDILIPSKNLAFEYNGLFYHSDKYKGANELILKTLACEEKDLKLVHIFEDEWVFKEDIVKSKIRNILNAVKNKIIAQETVVKEVDTKTANQFLEENHIQGKTKSKIRVGLYYKDELVSLITLRQIKEESFELIRSCDKINTDVIGGTLKLLEYFEQVYKPKQLVCYVDRRWSEGDSYFELGFTFCYLSKPNYFYTKGQKRFSRFGFRKEVLIKEGFDKEKTEKQIMEERGFFRVYDCGTMKFIKRY